MFVLMLVTEMVDKSFLARNYPIVMVGLSAAMNEMFRTMENDGCLHIRGSFGMTY